MKLAEIFSGLHMFLLIVIGFSFLVLVRYGIVLFVEVKKAIKQFNRLQPEIEHVITDVNNIQIKVNEINTASTQLSDTKTRRYGQIAGNMVSRRKKKQLKKKQKQEKMIEKKLKQLNKQEKNKYKAH